MKIDESLVRRRSLRKEKNSIKQGELKRYASGIVQKYGLDPQDPLSPRSPSRPSDRADSDTRSIIRDELQKALLPIAQAVKINTDALFDYEQKLNRFAAINAAALFEYEQKLDRFVALLNLENKSENLHVTV